DRSRTGGREGARWRNALIVLEVGLSIVLLTGAGLMIQTSWRLSHLNLGLGVGRVLNVRNSLRGATYATGEARRNHFATAAVKLAAEPSPPPRCKQISWARIRICLSSGIGLPETHEEVEVERT